MRSGGTYSLLTSKYAAWLLFGGVVVFWQYRLTMYQRTSEEVANVAAMTLQQDSLRRTIQETLTTVANSPETLASLSILFQKLITEERTEMHLINLIVRSLNSEGVRDAALKLLEVCFRNEDAGYGRRVSEGSRQRDSVGRWSAAECRGGDTAGHKERGAAAILVGEEFGREQRQQRQRYD